MTPNFLPPRLVPALLAIIGSATLFWFGNGLEPSPLLMWFAPLPVLLFVAQEASWRRAAGVAFVALFLGGLSMWGYFRVMGAPWGWFAVYTSVSAVFTGSALLFRARLRAGAPWSALLAFPAAMVTCEYLVGFTPGGSAGSLANTQLPFLPFLQLASVTGPYGMTFLLLTFPTSLVVAWSLRRSAPRRAAGIFGAVQAVLVLVLVFGARRLASQESAPTIKVGLVASDTRANVFVADAGAESTRLFKEYADAAAGLAARGAKIIVLPEKIGVFATPDQEIDSLFQGLADRTGASLVVGLMHVNGAAKTNQARVYSPFGPVATYDKRHLLPSFESNKMRPGTNILVLGDVLKTVGVAICKDLDHPGYVRQYGQAKAGLMLVPAWDFGVDRSWHGHIAIMRGVENGCTVARSAKEGYLYVSNSRGRILAETRSDSAPFATLLADAPTEHEPTFYSRFGDWFAWLAMAVFVLTLARLILHRREPPPAKTPRLIPAPS